MKKVSTIIIAVALLLGMAQCKKQETPSNAGRAVNITLNVGGNGSRHDVNPNFGTVDYTDGDVIYVGNNGKYIGFLTYADGTFSGTIYEPSTDDYLHFYFLGGMTPETAPTAGTTESFTVSIADQSDNLPVLSYAASSVKYTDASTEYTARLQNKCALVKFTCAVGTTEAVTVGGMKTEATVNFATPGITPTQTTGAITLYSNDRAVKWAILLPQDEVEVASVTIGNDNSFTANVPAVGENDYNDSGIAITAAAPAVPEGAISGVFSINASGQQVYFSQGNLQYGLSTRQWSFMEHQYDMVEYNDAYIENNYTNGDVNSVSLFGFGTSGRPNGSANYQPYNTAYVSDNGEGDHVFLYGPLVNGRMVNPTGEYYYADWGYNAISNGGNQQNMGWRTLTLDEWNYLLGPTYNNPVTNCREGYRFVKANVCGRNGLIILPDGWGDNNYQLNAYNNMGSYSNNSIDATAWATLEEQGAVFLPAAGYRRGGTYFPFAAVGTTGSYWTSSVVGDATSRVSYVDFNNDVIATNIPLNSYYGFSVRLVFPAN